MAGDAANAKGAGQVGTEALETSRVNANILLWFAAREGIKIDPNVVISAVAAESALKQQDPTGEDEAEFWTSYRALAESVKPATVESILSTCNHPFADAIRNRVPNLGNARRTKRNYTAFALVVLSILLVVQTYWFVMTSFGSTLEQNRNELDGIAGDLRLMTVLADQIRRDQANAPERDFVYQNRGQSNDRQSDDEGLREPEPDSVHDPLPANLSKNAKEALTERFARNPELDFILKNTVENMLLHRPMLSALVLSQEKYDSLLTVGFLTLNNKKYRKERLIAMMSNGIAVLKNPLWAPILLFASPGLKEQFDELGPSFGKFPSWEKFQSMLKNQMNDIDKFITSEDLEKVISQSASIPKMLSQYLLPALYGLLGGLTFILRTISREIRHFTFTRASSFEYSLRWPLGILAGVTVGLFFGPAQFAGLGAITPLGIAFLAGYGVELFFSMLDGLVRTFTRHDGPDRTTGKH